jgi:hypothetical protein
MAAHINVHANLIPIRTEAIKQSIIDIKAARKINLKPSTY